jgi:hypothetical protein
MSRNVFEGIMLSLFVLALALLFTTMAVSIDEETVIKDGNCQVVEHEYKRLFGPDETTVKTLCEVNNG